MLDFFIGLSQVVCFITDATLFVGGIWAAVSLFIDFLREGR